ncbi:MAG: dihydroorotase [Clostridia bacterium]|nr:dihydroorotase [Clostridia bacterium]
MLETRYTAAHDPRMTGVLSRFQKDSYCIFPGFCDVHVHFREPGFSYKETIRTGSLAAAHGGYTTVCAMPNLNPVPDSPEHLALEIEEIKKQAVIRVLPYGAITVEEKGEVLSDLAGMAEQVVAFSDDGHGVQSLERMEEAMRSAKALGKVIAAHCEDNTLVRGGCIHDGTYSEAHGLPGICSESEWGPIARDIELVRRTGCAYHVCHVSTKESVALIRKAKAEGVNITCETAPHYLVLDETDLEDSGDFKMNPPLRSPEDRKALIAGVQDGTIDMIATDHAPHGLEEKRRGLKGSPFGIVGLETAFPVPYTNLVLPGVISLDRLIALLTEAPRRRFGIAEDPDSFSIWDLEATETIDPETFLSMGRATPFRGNKVKGVCMATVYQGNIVYLREEA